MTLRNQVAVELSALALGLGVLLAFGCASVIDAGKNTYDAYQQIEESKEARRKAESERKAEEERQRVEAERDRIEADRMAAESAEEAEKEKYKDGPNTLEHGRRSFLWKPVSDNTGMPVLILPPRFTGKTRLVTVNGVALKRGSVANGYREHYRMNQHYTNAVTVQAEASDGYGGAWYRWTWVIQNPAIRNDSNITPRKDAI